MRKFALLNLCMPVAQCVNRCVRNGSIFIIVNNTNIKKCLFEMKSSTTDV